MNAFQSLHVCVVHKKYLHIFTCFYRSCIVQLPQNQHPFIHAHVVTWHVIGGVWLAGKNQLQRIFSCFTFFYGLKAPYQTCHVVQALLRRYIDDVMEFQRVPFSRYFLIKLTRYIRLVSEYGLCNWLTTDYARSNSIKMSVMGK